MRRSGNVVRLPTPTVALHATRRTRLDPAKAILTGGALAGLAIAAQRLVLALSAV